VTTLLATAEFTIALQQRNTDKMAALQAAEKNAATAHACVHAITLLIEEHASAAALEAEATMTALQLASTTAFSSAPPHPSFGGDAVIIAILHAQAYGVQNIHSLVVIVMDPSSTSCAHWHNQVLLSLTPSDDSSRRLQGESRLATDHPIGASHAVDWCSPRLSHGSSAFDADSRGCRLSATQSLHRRHSLSCPEVSSDHPRRSHWRAAMVEECAALMSNGSWDLVLRLRGANIVIDKWIFKHKFKADGTLSVPTLIMMRLLAPL
jgi:hypothetical protein